MGRAFDKAFPVAISLGMSPEQYWLGDCWLFAVYREARRLENERQEWLMWEMGAYVHDAILRCSPVLNPFSKSHEAQPWVEEPYGITARRTPEQQKAHAEKTAHEKMKTWVLNHRPKNA